MDVLHTEQKLIDRLPQVRGSYRENALLSKTNWFGVGGPAEILFRPEDKEDLAYFLQYKPSDVPVMVIGVGSNLLVRDGGIDGVVIKLGRNFAAVTREGTTIHAGTGALSFNTAHFAQHCGLSGLEFLVGIPGTIGGALAMNAGAYGSETAAHLLEAEALDEQGNTHRLTPVDMGFVYRGNTLPEGWIFTKAIFKTVPAKPEDIAARMEFITTSREASQPVKTRTSGSTFVNPTGHKAWELIDRAGCRGLTMGGAIVSEKHCNFLINQDNASAHDLESLGEEVRRRVYEQSGIMLEWEVKRIGKP
jgi:UDP-N-acetylmuramate dehydrogenase